MALYPDVRSAVDPGAARRPARARLVLADGDRAGRVRDAVTPAYLAAVATFYDMFSTVPKGRNDIFVCTNISCSLRGADELLQRMLDVAGDDPDFDVRSFECLGACDIAPMASVNGEYVGPLDAADCDAIVEDLPRGAGGPAGQAAAPSSRRAHVLAAGEGRGVMETLEILFKDIDEPGLNTPGVYERLGGYGRCARR